MDAEIKILKYLYDVNTCILPIDIHLSNQRNYNSYISNITVQRAVERELEIIGEAINNIVKINPAINITYARLIIDLRNKIIHSYDNINNDVIWKIVNKDIPILKQEINLLLNKYSTPK